MALAKSCQAWKYAWDHMKKRCRNRAVKHYNDDHGGTYSFCGKHAERFGKDPWFTERKRRGR